MNWKENCIHLSKEHPDLGGYEWCVAKDKYIKDCPEKCSKYDFMPDIKEKNNE